ncbi:spermidine/putrescine ABC transporter substrate-binding protein [Nibricoccus sp. IMCC34717]|uniref:polyamine ABC transporter substrate-binding protein n=1 Tax=Nibricoccus sp. IMCC34717 TaxID=3034021 RepID=UPI00384EF503
MKSIRLVLSLISVAACTAVFAAKQELNLYAWSEYIPQEVVDGFSKETGIAVNYETFSSNEELLAKLVAGGTAYDLVQPSDYMVEVMIREKLVQPLDRSKLKNVANLAPEFQSLPCDPDLAFCIPYMSGTVGIVVNTETITEPVRGYRDLFQAKHANRIVVLNDNREMVSWALASEGISANDVTPENLERARVRLKEWLPLVKLFDSDSPKTALLNGDVDLGIVWSGEAALLWKESHKFSYVIPEEGAHRFIDVLTIPTKAKNVHAAHLFIDYILRPEVSKLISDAFPYTNPNAEARKLLTEDQLANPASYPKSGKLEVFHDIGKTAQVIDKLVTDLKTGH